MLASPTKGEIMLYKGVVMILLVVIVLLLFYEKTTQYKVISTSSTTIVKTGWQTFEFSPPVAISETAFAFIEYRGNNICTLHLYVEKKGDEHESR